MWRSRVKGEANMSIDLTGCDDGAEDDQRGRLRYLK